MKIVFAEYRVNFTNFKERYRASTIVSIDVYLTGADAIMKAIKEEVCKEQGITDVNDCRITKIQKL